MEQKQEFLFKVLVVGDAAVGKTSIIRRFVHQTYSKHYKTTIGVDFALKVIHWDEKTLVRMQLWDIAGPERYGNMTRVYYRDAVGAFVVFDVERSSTYEAVEMWKNDLDNKAMLPDGSRIPVVLLGNKCDTANEGLRNNAEQLNRVCTEKGFVSWFPTSAKNNINLDNAMQLLVKTMLSNSRKSHVVNIADVKKKVDLNKREVKRSSCCS